jgi:nucleoid-associated protein YgaU
MGLFSFLKDTGAKLFHMGGDAKPLDPNADIIAHKNEVIAKLQGVISGLGLQIDNGSMDLNDAGDTVTVYGSCQTQSEKEKVILAIGNTEGIAYVDDRTTVANPEPEADFYTVQKGDSLSKIAKHFYGDMMRYPEIFEANKPMLTHPDLIYPGQVLRVPKH